MLLRLFLFVTFHKKGPFAMVRTGLSSYQKLKSKKQNWGIRLSADVF